MYLFEDMIGLGLCEGEEWTSPDHRQVAVYSCLSNPAVSTRESLEYNVGIINSIPQGQIRTITSKGLRQLGCTL